MISKNGSCDGFSPAAKCLALDGLGLLIDQGSRGFMIGRGVYSKRSIIALPEVAKDVLELTVLSGLDGSALSADQLSWGLEAAEMRNEWMLFGRAYVHFMVDMSAAQPLKCISYDAFDDEVSALFSPNALTMFDKHFGSLILEVAAYLQRCGHHRGQPAFTERARELLKFQHYQPRRGEPR